jgi:hypothetical protein
MGEGALCAIAFVASPGGAGHAAHMPAARTAATIEVMANVERMEDPQFELNKRTKIGSRDDATAQSEDEARAAIFEWIDM